MTLDPKTLQLMILVTSFAMVVALATVAAGHRVVGLWSLAGSTLANVVTFGLYYAHEHLAPNLVSILSDGTIALTFSLVLQAIVQLRGQPIHRMWIWTPPLATLVLSTLLQFSNGLRGATSDAICVVQGVVAIWALTRNGGIGVGRGRHILLASLAVAVLLFATRSAGVVSGLLEIQPPPSATTADTVSYLIAYLIMVFSVLGYVLAAAEITADQHHQLAMQDALTGLPNRRAVLDMLSRYWSAALRSERPLTVLMIDVDHFKKVNDEHGHAAGDAVLRRLSRLLRMRVRQQDAVGRYGGEEFLVLLPDTDRDGGLALADALRAKIASVPVRARGKDLPVTVSVGLCSLYPTDADSIPDLLHHADQALYRAKGGGRNCVVAA
jgi:diguanylate cyclase (GGDEF)-like protein